MNKPLISVIIPAYNAERYLSEALESALSQTYPEVEVIVVNDGSTDRTTEVLGRYTERVRIVEQNNQGIGAARNKGLEFAQGTFFSFLDANDLWPAERLEILHQTLSNLPSPASAALSGFWATITWRYR